MISKSVTHLLSAGRVLVRRHLRADSVWEQLEEEDFVHSQVDWAWFGLEGPRQSDPTV